MRYKTPAAARMIGVGLVQTSLLIGSAVAQPRDWLPSWFGNSDGDLEMIEWTTAGSSARFGLIVHHTDADREWAYDRESSIGRGDPIDSEHTNVPTT